MMTSTLKINQGRKSILMEVRTPMRRRTAVRRPKTARARQTPRRRGVRGRVGFSSNSSDHSTASMEFTSCTFVPVCFWEFCRTNQAVEANPSNE